MTALRRTQSALAAIEDRRARGFEYPEGSGKRFEISPRAQAFYEGLGRLVYAGQIVYPHKLQTLDGSLATFADHTSIVAFIFLATRAYCHWYAETLKAEALQAEAEAV